MNRQLSSKMLGAIKAIREDFTTANEHEQERWGHPISSISWDDEKYGNRNTMNALLQRGLIEIVRTNHHHFDRAKTYNYGRNTKYVAASYTQHHIRPTTDHQGEWI
jgi:hypothetical protein|tara:strand:+ start:350 stop:667 length:318 start_codon:yes stop_codon:yes gene_type:complete